MIRPISGIATDGAHSTKRKLTRYRAVDIETGEELFSRSIGNQTINIGEFLGVVDAVKYIIDNNCSPPPIIYTDSITAIAWFKAKRTASKKRNKDLVSNRLRNDVYDIKKAEFASVKLGYLIYSSISAHLSGSNSLNC